MTKAELTSKDAIKNLHVKVVFYNPPTTYFRAWLARNLFIIGGIVLGCDIRVKISTCHVCRGESVNCSACGGSDFETGAD